MSSQGNHLPVASDMSRSVSSDSLAILCNKPVTIDEKDKDKDIILENSNKDNCIILDNQNRCNNCSPINNVVIKTIHDTDKHASNPSTRIIQRAIKATSVALNNWDSQLNIGVFVNGIFQKKYNILEVTSKNKGLIPPYIYFDPSIYPIENGFVGEGWKNLLQHLERESFKEGFSVCCNGYGNASKQTYRRIVCKHSLLYRNKVEKRKAVSSYRKTRVTNDRLNGRGSVGRTMERRSRTARPTDKDQCCPFFFTIGFDTNGFFIRNGQGCSNHYGHPKVVSSKYNYPIRLLTDEEKLIAKSVIDADASKGIVRNVIGKRTGQIVSLQACHYLGTLGKDLKRLASLDGLSSSDRIIDFFQDKGYDYILLYNSMNQSQSDSVDLMNDNYISSSSLYSNTKFVVPPREQLDASSYACDNRANRNLHNEQNLLVALTWVVPTERRLFTLFPETLFVDSVEDTNNEGRPLLTMSGCDSNGKMFTFLRAFLPNQRTWSFRWIFLHVLPTMFSKETIDRIRVIISDGDSQEYQQIDVAINTFCHQTLRVRCGWHVIDRGWMRHGPKSNHYKDKKSFKEITTKIRVWMFSWTSSACESEEEYQISKTLFLKYVVSKSVTDTLDTNFSELVIKFFRNYVEPVLPYMLFYKRKHVRHFDNYTNVKIEGTYRGIKHCSTPVTPSTSLYNSVAILSNIAERNSGNSFRNKTSDVLCKKTWINLSCGDDLNLRGEQLLTDEWNKRTMYVSFRSSPTHWLVKYNDNNDTNKKSNHYKTIYPLFKRIRKVTVNKSVFYCSCLLFERFGIPCRHIFSILDSFPKYKEPSINDVSVIYWKAYSQYCYPINSNSDEKSLKVGKLLANLRNKDILGPSCPSSCYKSIPICDNTESSFNLSKIECRNYDIQLLNHSDSINVPSGYGLSMSLSQNPDYEGFCISNEELLDDDCESEIDSQSVMHKVNAYAELNPIFKELVQHMHETCDVIRVKSYLTSQLNLLKQKVNCNTKEQNTPSGTFVSCHANHVKRRKTHGTKYYSK